MIDANPQNAGLGGENKEDNFRALIEAVQAGSEDAVWELIETYEPHIRRVVRRRMNRQLQAKFDTMDFVQMVWKSFFFRPVHLCSFNGSSHFLAYLTKMAMNKVDTEHRRRFDTKKYDVNKEEAMDDDHLAAPGESPSQIVMVRDHWDAVLGKLPPHHREVVRLRLEGFTHPQIAKRLQLNERTTRRILSDILDSSVSN